MPQNNQMEHVTDIDQCHVILLFPREQRVTGIVVFILTGLSVFMAPILKVVHELINSSVKVRITVFLP